MAWARSARTLMREMSVESRMLRRDDGERRLTNLLHLAELLQAASQAHPAPESLAGWLSSQRAEAVDGTSVE
jgi:exodeoxyribonuclease V beta subunit